MQSKSLLIAIAAFAVTVTGVQAYGGAKVLARANLTEEQRSALEEAHELRENGDTEAARNVLIEAGIDEEAMRSLREASREVHAEMHDAIEAGDYEAFKELIADTPLADIITSEADFELFKEAHELRQSGDHDGARAIMDELGFEEPEHGPHGRGFGGGKMGPDLSQLTDEQRSALQVAREANDRDTVRAILEEAGIGPRQ